MSYDYQKIRAAIVPIESLTLTIKEDRLFQKYQPAGYILFCRNYQNPQQLKKLIDDLKTSAGREDILILIDQEGERVSRLKEPNFKVLPNAIEYGKQAKVNLQKTASQLQADFTAVGKQLQEIGINVNYAPVADLYHTGADPIIGVRSYGSDIETVVTLCKAVDIGLAKAKVQSVIKHIPGHGRALVDSHIDLPIINSDLKTLEQTDFEVFKQLNQMKLAMTAHVIFSAIDNELPVTLSKKAIDYIKNHIGFQGLISTDALDMGALRGNISNVTKQASEAGCDLLLYCKPNLLEIKNVLQQSHFLTSEIVYKMQALNCFI